MNQQFFGHPEAPLFGVHHQPRRAGDSNRVVVICPPIGQEFVRTHWALRLLATQLSRRQIHVLRFDYHGIGDSAGKLEQVHSLEIWERNIRQAIDHIKSLTGVDSVMLIGQRLGGLLAGKVASTSPEVNSLVLWESVFSGSEYLQDLRKMHSQMLDLWVCKMTTANDSSHEEILGSLYSRTLIDELERATLKVENLRQPHLIVESPRSQQRFSHEVPSIQRVMTANRDGAWNDLRELESAFLRPLTSNRLVKTIDDMFDRLDRFNAISSTNQGAKA